MRSKHKNIGKLKARAIAMRRRGAAYPDIEAKLNVSRSTLSYWLGKLPLSRAANKKILDRKEKHLVRARALSSQWHRNERLGRIEELKKEIHASYKRLPFDKTFLEALLASLYLGEGFKNQATIGLGNANPKIVGMFVNLCRWIYLPDESKFRCYLHLRMDQDAGREKVYWSDTLSIPESQFRKPQFDRRTLGKKTYPDYHGVCVVYYYSAELAKRMMVWQELLLEKTLGV
jgi:hypothetical protein